MPGGPDSRTPLGIEDEEVDRIACPLRSRWHSGPHGDAERDPEYMNKSGATGADRITYRIPVNSRTRGAASVRVTLNYQAIPPSYLRDRFTIGNGAETQRLAYLTSHLNLEHSPIEGWKLPIVSATRRLGDK